LFQRTGGNKNCSERREKRRHFVRSNNRRRKTKKHGGCGEQMGQILNKKTGVGGWVGLNSETYSQGSGKKRWGETLKNTPTGGMFL